MIDIDYWKRIILKLPDAAFFDIVRNYLGEFKTPFNKHALIEDLTVFLKRPATRERIALCLSEDDAKILTAITILGNPTEETLASFFAGEKTYLELHHQILNLEERLLVFLDMEHEKPKLTINPIFEDLVRESAYTPNALFPSIEVSAEQELAYPWLSESLLTAFLSFILKRLKVLKADGQMKKKIEDEMGQILPDLLRDTRRGTRFSLLLTGLKNLGLIGAQDSLIRPDMDKWRAFALLPKDERFLYLTAAATCPQETPSIRVLQETAQIIRGLLKALPEGRAYTIQALVRLASVSDGNSDFPQKRYEYLIDTLVDFGILIPADEWGYYKHPNLSSMMDDGSSSRARTAEPPLILQPNFTLTVKPWLSLEDSILIACVSDIEHYDLYPQYTLSKHSFIRIFDYGITASDVLSRLKSLSGQDVPQNVAFSVTSWENDYGSLKFFKGVICVADKAKTHIIEHTEVMKPWIKKTFAPGLYLLDPDEREEWENAFKKVGIDPVPGMETTKPHDKELFPSSEFPGIANNKASVRIDILKTHVQFSSTASMTKELYGRLEELSLPKEASEEIRARIQKRLILFPDQINAGMARQEKTEAKGLDYIGKVRLIEQAIASKKDLLEVIERTAKGSPRRILIKPEETKKTENDLILIGKTLPEEEEIKIFVRKASLVRKLKSSLFAP